MAKSITALAFMRAMTQRLISPEDPLGSLIREADRPHGAITMRNLLTMTSGLHWNGFRDYNIFMPDRLQEALTVDVEKPRGTYFEYSQSGPALLAEAVGRAVGMDFQAYLQRELFTPLGIEAGAWRWGRDSQGHTQGFFDLHMTPNDYARLGELLRRDGVWRGRRLIAHRVMKAAIRPTKTNGCYGWMIWLNRPSPASARGSASALSTTIASSPSCRSTCTTSPGSSASWWWCSRRSGSSSCASARRPIPAVSRAAATTRTSSSSGCWRR